MKTRSFALRCTKEILRDPLTVIFSLGFPLALLGLFTAIQANVPVALFELPHITPGLAVFGLSFMTLFCATLLAKDRESALLQRLYTTPMTALDFILGYTLPILPISLAQCVVTFAFAVVLGLEITVGILWAVLFILPVSLLYIMLGLLFGSILTSKQVGGVCGALLTNMTALLSGVWFDVSMVGGVFYDIAKLLPFIHAVELERAVMQGDFSQVPEHLAWVLGYTLVAGVAAVWCFLRQMKR